MTTDDTRPLSERLAVEFGKAGFFGHAASMEFLTRQAEMMLADAGYDAERARHAALVAAARALLDHELDERGQVLEVEDNSLHLALRAALDGEGAE